MRVTLRVYQLLLLVPRIANVRDHGARHQRQRRRRLRPGQPIGPAIVTRHDLYAQRDQQENQASGQKALHQAKAKAEQAVHRANHATLGTVRQETADELDQQNGDQERPHHGGDCGDQFAAAGGFENGAGRRVEEAHGDEAGHPSRQAGDLGNEAAHQSKGGRDADNQHHDPVKAGKLHYSVHTAAPIRFGSAAKAYSGRPR